MKTKILLIDEEDVKAQSLIEMNVAQKGLRVIIKDVQHNQLRKMMTNEPYYALLARVENSLDDQSEDYAALTDADLELIQDYVQPFLVTGTVCDFIILNNHKLTNKGVFTLTDTNAQSVQFDSLESLKNYYDNKHMVAKTDLIEYLSILNNDCSGDSNPANNITSSGTGLYIEPVDYSHYFRSGRNRYL